MPRSFQSSKIWQCERCRYVDALLVNRGIAFGGDHRQRHARFKAQKYDNVGVGVLGW
jgi:hypothetical protein